MKTFLLGLLVVSLFGCSMDHEKVTAVTFDFANDSIHPLNWAKFVIGDRELSAGILGPGISKTTLDVPWSKMPDQAKVTFIDDKTRQSYAIIVSLVELNKRVQAGSCKTVTLRIVDYDKAEISCE
jgi:hypothetical protein